MHFSRFTFLAACLGIGTYIAFMLLDNVPPYVWDVEKSYALPSPAIDGGRVTVFWKIKTVNRICPASSQRTFRDASTRDLDKDGNRIPYSGDLVATYDATPAASSVRSTDDRIVRTFVLPRGLPTTVDYSSHVCFSCNPLQKIWPLCLDTPELTFEVSPNKGADLEPDQTGKMRP